MTAAETSKTTKTAARNRWREQVNNQLGFVSFRFIVEPAVADASPSLLIMMATDNIISCERKI
jgi:hypothetical protein